MDDLVVRLRADWCHCLDVYKRMGRADPQCASCDTKDDRHEAADAIERLRAENAALREDAERYQWLRAYGPALFVAQWDGRAPLDAAIDAARKAPPKPK